MAKVSASKTVGVSRDALRKRAEKEQAAKDSEGSKKAGRLPLNDSEAAIKIYEAAARLDGGPLDGAVYYVSDLEQRRRAAEAMGRSFEYEATRRKCTLPWTGGVEGVWWKYVGSR